MTRKDAYAGQAPMGPIAVVGMGCRFPGGADSPEALWRMLIEGRDGIVDVPAARWPADAWYSADRDAPGKMNMRRAGFLARGIAGFDAPFFGVAPREALAMDPHQRLALEVAWEALEDAAIAPDRLAGSATGVFLGLYNGNYGLSLRGSPAPEGIHGWTASGAHPSVAAGRLSYFLDLAGPSLVVDTACSSSLVAVHLAVQSLQARECDLALAGGVHLMLGPEALVASTKLGATAPDGRCKAFDASADGFGHGEGCGVVVLKRLDDALAAHDRVIAVIRGSCVNQDGRSNSLTAPSGPAQESAVRAALARAGIEPHRVGYVEAHGTGTPLGDPIEIEALAAVLGEGRDTPLMVGSIKGNLGHLEAAAGIAGFIKAALCVERGVVPAHLHFDALNPEIDAGDVELRIPVEAVRWDGVDGRRIAGVSAFGFSGTNAHVVLEAPPAARSEARHADAPQVLALSARTPAALERLAARWAEWLDTAPHAQDAAFTAGTGRRHHRHRIAVVAESWRGLAQQLRARPEVGGAERAPRIAWLFTGQGSQYAGMGARAYATQPVFRDEIERHARVLDRVLGRSSLDLLFGERDIDDTALAQPLVVAVELALAALWRSWGLEPAAVMGHSLGEYAAAAVAGVLTEEAVLELVAERGRLMAALPPGGGMLVVSASAARIEAQLASAGGRLSIAALNGAGNTVVSGELAALERLAAELRAQGLRCAQLAVSHAFHSALIDPVLPALEHAAAAHAACAPTVPVVSNLTGRAHRHFDAAYWRDHARQPVRFFAGLEALAALGCDTFLEIGPQAVLSGMGAASQPDARFVPSLRRGTPDDASLAQALAALYRAGAPIRWDAVHAGAARRKLAAPTYPFEHEQYWLPVPAARASAPPSVAQPAADANATGTAVVYDFYDELTVISGEHDEGNLSFGFLPAPSRGFSWIRALFDRDESSGERTLFRTSQQELKDALFAGIDFSRVTRVMDYGCGHAADVCRLAVAHPHLELHGYTISARQVEVGRRRAERLGVGSRVSLARSDSSAVPFPGSFDLVFGIEVTGLVPDKEALFDNIAAHLAPGGLLAIADFVSTGDAIVNPETSSYTPAAAQWAQLLASRRLRLVRAIDGSEDVADWLVDADFEANLEAVVERHGFGALTRRHLRSNENIGKGLRQGLMRYLLLTAQHAPYETEAQLARTNEAMLRAPSRYRDGTRARGERSWQSWIHEIAWTPAEPAPPLPDTAVLARGLAAAVECERAALAPYAAAGASLDALTRAYVAEAFAALGCRETADCARAPVVEPMRRLRDHLARELAKSGLQPGDAHAAALAQRALAAHPEAAAELALLTRCGPRLADALAGRVPPLELLFPGGDATLAESLYERSLFSQAVQRLAGAVVAALPRGRALSVVEIGGGTGATTANLLPHLPAGSRYLFTDIAPSLVERAREKFAGRGAEFATYDVSLPPSAQRIATGAFDVAVAANVLHATPELAAAVAHARDLLAPGGVLLLVENTGRLAWGDVTFGLTPGMWNFRDTALRDHALVTQAQWRAVLAQAGFEGIEILTPGEPDRGGVSQQCVILARRGARRHWLLAGPRESREALARELSATGDACTLADTGDLRALTAGITDVACIAPDDAADASAVLAPALAAAKAVGAMARPPRLALVAQGALGVAGCADRVVLAHAPLAGFARAAAAELPESRVRLVDLDPAHAFDAQAAALGRMLRDGRETESALRDGVFHRPALGASPVAAAELRLDPAASYIVTGAFGGIGLEMLPWMARHGARALVLGVRRAAGPREQAALDALRAQGIDVRVETCDVSRAADVRRLVDAAVRVAPLKGVFHAAGIVADAALARQDAASVEAVFAAKVRGTLHLHEATAPHRLDHFVLFSSAASLLGPAGQANHAAANEFAGTFAHWRRARGLAALAIDWGAWADVGAAARGGIDERVSRSGLVAMAPAQALEAMGHAMASGRARLAIVACDWPRYLERFPAGGVPTLLQGFASPGDAPRGRTPAAQPGVAERRNARDLRARIERSPPVKREDVLREAIRGEAARVMALPGATSIDDERPLRDLGLDSLMSVELRNALVSACGAKLPATLLFDHPTIAALAQELARGAFADLFPAEARTAPDLESLGVHELSALLEAELRDAAPGGGA